MAHASDDPMVDDAEVGSVKLRSPLGRRIGKTSMYLNHRAIIDSALIVTPSSGVIEAAAPWPVEQPALLAGFRPWQLATIGALATAAWAAPIGLLIAFLG